MQNAYGLGSGNMAQAQLARETGLTADLTELRRAQLAADAELGAERITAQKSYADTLTKALQQNEEARAQAMYAEALTQKPKTKAKAKPAAPVQEQYEVSDALQGVISSMPYLRADGNYEEWKGKASDRIINAVESGTITKQDAEYLIDKWKLGE